MTHSLANFMKRFFSHYLPVQKGLSANTIAAYRDAIKLLLCNAADTLRKPVDKLAIEDITEKVVLGFLDYVQEVRRCSSRTDNHSTTERLSSSHCSIPEPLGLCVFSRKSVPWRSLCCPCR